MRKSRSNTILIMAICTVLAFFFGACSKGDDGGSDADNGSYYFRFKMDGVQKQMPFKSADYVYVKSRKRHVLFSMSGKERRTVESPNPTLSLYIDGAITEGENDTWVGADIVAGKYVGNSGGTPTAQWGQVWNYNTNGLDGYWIHEEDFVLDLQHVDKTFARGTFSGTLKNDDGKLMKITDGVFNLKVNYREEEN